MPAVLTGDAAILARRTLPKPPPEKPDPIAELAIALRAFSEQLQAAHSKGDAHVAAAIAEQSRITATAMTHLAGMLGQKDDALLNALKALERKPETVEMRVTERDNDGRIAAVRFKVL